jgi:hypothetical protein
MVDRPILFSGPMVRALLDGRKTQTRRVAKLNGRTPTFGGPKGQTSDPNCWGWEQDDAEWILLQKDKPSDVGYLDLATTYQPGDRLWVREAFTYDHVTLEPVYRADAREDGVAVGGWRPSIHMPRDASRLTLIVEDVRVERLQAISEADATAEGLLQAYGGWVADSDGRCFGKDPQNAFRALWESINGAESWAANPWVVAVSFRVVRANIDDKSLLAGWVAP